MDFRKKGYFYTNSNKGAFFLLHGHQYTDLIEDPKTKLPVFEWKASSELRDLANQYKELVGNLRHGVHNAKTVDVSSDSITALADLD